MAYSAPTSKKFLAMAGNIGCGKTTAAKLLSQTEVQIGVRNIFQKEPPVDVTGPTYYSGFGDPRVSSYYISVKKSF